MFANNLVTSSFMPNLLLFLVGEQLGYLLFCLVLLIMDLVC